MNWLELAEYIMSMKPEEQGKQIDLVIADQPGHPVVGTEVTIEANADGSHYLKAWQQK